MAAFILVACIAITAIYLFQTFGPFASAAPASLSPGDRTQLAAKYQAIADITNPKESTAKAELSTVVLNNASLSQLQQAYAGYRDVESEFMTNLKSVNWLGASTEAKALEDLMAKEVDILDRAANGKSVDDINAILNNEWDPIRPKITDAVTALRAVLGIPLPVETPTPEVTGTVGPTGATQSSGTPSSPPPSSGSPLASPTAS